MNYNWIELKAIYIADDEIDVWLLREHFLHVSDGFN